MQYPIKTSLVFPVLAMFMLTLLGCGKSEHSPRPGEYGQKIVSKMQLTSAQVDALNASVMPKPDMNDGNLKIGIEFTAQQEDNPYRFVVVSRGQAISNGEVELRWFGGVESQVSNGYAPEAYIAEDSSSYDAGEQVLLINASEPFSVSKKEFDVIYYANAQLTKRENIQFDSVELQIWQGKGGKYSMTRYLWLFAVVFMVLMGIHRVYGIATNRR